MKYQAFEPSSTKRVLKEPMRTAAELCEEFGVTSQELAKMAENDAAAPRGIALNGVRPLRYPLHSMRKWWKGYQP